MDILKSWREGQKRQRLWQLVAFVGDGTLRDNNQTSQHLRNFFDQVQSDDLIRFVVEILSGEDKNFSQSGAVLQDLVNQIGKRLGFNVEYGRYQGVRGTVGHDGLWRFPEDNHSIIVEVKTTDAYRIDLDRVVKYRTDLVAQNSVGEEASSILIVVGRQDTGGLESQVRGSKHAWDIRIISIDALLDLMKIGEELEDPTASSRIQQILIPHEFTRLDDIVDLLFVAATDLKHEELVEPNDEMRTTPSSFHDACVAVAQERIEAPLVRRSKARYSTVDGSVAVTCHVSKDYERAGYQYWFAFHPHQAQFLEGATKAFVLFGCGSPAQTILIPYREFHQFLDTASLNVTERGDGFYYHIQIAKDKDKFWLVRKRGFDPLDISMYAL